MTQTIPELVLPPNYENIASILGSNSAQLLKIIIPLQAYERQVTEVLRDVRRNLAGCVVFIQGVSGVGKTTFINSLELRKQYLPIRRLVNINANEFGHAANPGQKLPGIYSRLWEVAKADAEFTDREYSTCVALNYLENLNDEPQENITAFFRDLNGLLRKAPLLVLWPVTAENDLRSILNLALSVSGTLVSTRHPVIDFAGPPMEKFADIAKNTIRVLNDGRPVHDFQLKDDDFEQIRKKLESAQKKKQTIGTYLLSVRERWEERTNYVKRLAETIPDQTEVWFMVCYPKAEQQVEGFSQKAFSLVENNWNIRYPKLSEYVINNQQRGADWQDQRLLTALRLFRAKVLFLPTNSFVNAVAAFGEDIEGFPLTRDDFQEWGVPDRWFAKSKARLTLGTSPIIRQLVGREPTVGGRAGGENRAKAIDTAAKSFQRITEGISSRAYSDTRFNQALALALDAAYRIPPNKLSHDFPEDRPELTFTAEVRHAWLSVIPDITIKGFKDKTICVEMRYSFDPQDSDLADYILRKLHVYMAQYESLLLRPAVRQLPLKNQWLDLD